MINTIMQKNYCKNWNTKKTICFDSKTQSMLLNHDIEVRSNINCWKTAEANRIKNPATKKLKMNRPKRGRDVIKKPSNQKFNTLKKMQ